MIVIDFFCGCGGASEGLRQAGFDIELGLDIDQQASETFKANFPDAKFIQDDIRKIEPQDISDIIDIKAKEGANKQVISSQADSLIKISRIWADFFPANTSNQPI